MDSVITLDEVNTLLADAPDIPGRPNFENLRTFRRHVIDRLKTLPCPQSQMMGWAGIIMSPVLYALIENTPFTAPADPGKVAHYI